MFTIQQRHEDIKMSPRRAGRIVLLKGRSEPKRVLIL